MKKRLSVLLVLLLVCSLCACERNSVSDEETATPSPEATAGTGLTAAVQESIEEQNQTDAAVSETQEPDVQDLQTRDANIQPVTDDVSIDDTETETSESDTSETDTEPQIVESVSGYSTVDSTSLGIRFNYPSSWVNLPGRSSICFREPETDGKYPARVCVTVKKLPHKCDDDKLKEQLISYLKLIQSQYDEKTFEVDTKNVDINTKLMGKAGMATTYMAYDDKTEIQGYVIMSYFGKYVVCFHFMCAYDDYRNMYDAMTYMRNSVTLTASTEE